MVENNELDTAELALLGGAIQSAGAILDELEFDPADFLQPVYQRAWRAIETMKRDGRPIDSITAANELAQQDPPISPAIIHQAVEASPSPASASYYAEIISDQAARRRLASAGQAITALAHQPGPIDEIIENARTSLDENTQVNISSPVEFVWETIDQTIENFDAADHSMPTPWPSLNEIIGGLQPGKLYTVGARPGVGKSVMGIELALAMANYGGVAFLSLEMSQDDVNKRILANQKHIPMNRLNQPAKLTERDFNAIAHWRAEYRAPLAVNKSPHVTLTEVRRFSRNVHQRAPLAGIVVDYLQLINQAPNDQQKRQEFIANISRGLKTLALEIHVPVIMLSQLNREVEGRPDKRPVLSDLRESGAIEQDSDVVLLLHRDITDEGKAHELEMIVAKNRHGRPGGLVFDFLGHYSKVREAQPGW